MFVQFKDLNGDLAVVRYQDILHIVTGLSEPKVVHVFTVDYDIITTVQYAQELADKLTGVK